MQVIDTPLEGVKILQPRVFEDDRGFFMETFNSRHFEPLGLPTRWVQDNHSRSTRGVLRGLHYQSPDWQGKLVRVVVGEIFDVAVDIRPDSPSFGRWFGTVLSAGNKQQLYVPEGYAHGFCVTSDVAEVIYKCTRNYEAEQDAGIRWDDPEIGVDWPLTEPLVSDKDRAAPTLADYHRSLTS